MNINRENYETFFLLYLDRELDPADMQVVERFLNENSDLQKEFAILQQTVLMPAEMVYEHKETLFRREEKRRVIPFYRMRIAAAVAALILGGWFITTRVIKNQAEISSVNNPDKGSINSKVQTAESSKTESAKVDEVLNSSPAVNATGTEKNSIPAAKKTPAANKNDLNQNPRDVQTAVISQHDLSEDGRQGIGNELSGHDGQNPAVNMSDENMTAVQKNSNGLELQTKESGKGSDPQQIAAAPGNQAPPLLIASVNTKDTHQESVLSEQDFQSDNAVSVIALNEKNKAITGFFKKLTKRTPAVENARTVRVSVFQFSY